MSSFRMSAPPFPSSPSTSLLSHGRGVDTAAGTSENDSVTYHSRRVPPLPHGQRPAVLGIAPISSTAGMLLVLRSVTLRSSVSTAPRLDGNGKRRRTRVQPASALPLRSTRRNSRRAGGDGAGYVVQKRMTAPHDTAPPLGLQDARALLPGPRMRPTHVPIPAARAAPYAV
ncbi:hypothetical protein B0H15DRAFT_1026868 [Mycena belliarum]|uniref:Uncharacterized protein n=1 Tax=Mycena belliarum TaxID=1033014 RepID=A0AAD6TU11_9AGAR|nr:hypothetical protein B0H15DRAFT_1026868 [Mycena belliae]